MPRKNRHDRSGSSDTNTQNDLPNNKIPEKTVEDLLFPGGIETLIAGENRKELPEISKLGRRSILVDLVNYAPSLYSKLMVLIKSGVYFHVAAEVIGVNQGTFHDWVMKGLKDLDADKDTYYSRFFLDVRRSAAVARADCEMVVKEKDPKKWLTLGPGRMFGNQWAKDTPASLPSIEEENPNSIEQALSLQVTDGSDSEGSTDDGQQTVLTISQEDTQEALEVMEKAGLGEFQFNEKFKDAAEKAKPSINKSEE